MKFITLSGVDGSGKSSQLERLREKLVDDGTKVAYFHAIEFSLANRIARFLRRKKETFTPGSERAVTEASYLTIILRELFLFADMLRFSRFFARLNREGYEYLLSDRSFYDSLVNIAYLKRSNPVRDPYAHWLVRRLPRADVAFYLDLEPEVAYSRERVPEQGLDYLKAKRALYRAKAAEWEMIVIDAGRDKDQVFNDIAAHLK